MNNNNKNQLNKRFVKLTEDQTLLLGHIDKQIAELRKRNLSSLNQLGQSKPEAPSVVEAVAASIYMYQKTEETIFV